MRDLQTQFDALKETLNTLTAKFDKLGARLENAIATGTVSTEPAAPRVVRSHRPTKITDAIVAVMAGGVSMSKTEVFKAMEAANTLPHADYQEKYIGHTMSTRKDLFERTKRGQYRLKGSSAPVIEGVVAPEAPASVFEANENDIDQEAAA